MPSQKRAAYRIVLRGAKGFAKLRYATSFEIFYGKRRVLARRPFPLIYKKVADKKDFLGDLIQAIDKKRQRVLAKQKAKRKREREIIRKLDHARDLKKLLNRKLPKLERDFKNRYLYGKRFESQADADYAEERKRSADALPVFPKVYDVEPATAMATGKFVIDTMIIPMAPEGAGFSKQIFDKEMQSNSRGLYHLATLDFTLKESFAFSGLMYREAYNHAVQTLLPHILRYFQDTKNSASEYILRLKFMNSWDKNGEYEPHGISETRTEVRTIDGMIHLFKKTIARLGGDVGIANYLQGDNIIYITGFTLEAMAETN